MSGDNDAAERLRKEEESNESKVGKTDSRVFWTALYVTPVIWAFLCIMQLLSFRIFWLNTAGVCFALSLTNA